MEGHPRAILCDGGDTSILAIQFCGSHLGCKLESLPLKEETARHPRVWVLPHMSC